MKCAILKEIIVNSNKYKKHPNLVQQFLSVTCWEARKRKAEARTKKGYSVTKIKFEQEREMKKLKEQRFKFHQEKEL